jgi:hypothetical protein
MANLKTKDIADLKSWNAKELRKLRMTVRNRIAALEKSTVKELAESNPLAGMEMGECKALLDKILRVEKGQKKA